MKSSGIGGQAVIEGVMMKNKENYAVAVRKPDNEIVVEKKAYKSIGEKYTFLKFPIIRGVVAFIESMVLGMKTISFSAGFYEEEEEKQKKSSKTEKMEPVVMTITVIIAIIMAVAIFMILPLLFAEYIGQQVESDSWRAVIEGGLRLFIFIGYIAAISQMKDIKRVFMYHGAEHKTINCIENGHELTVENVKKQSKHHKRCGTSFMLVVMFVSIIFFVFIHVDTLWMRIVYRILLVPVIAGVSYEFIRLAGNSEGFIVSSLSKPGMWLQSLTTREPDNSMIEVAIQSVEAVFDWRAYLNENREEEEKEKLLLEQLAEDKIEKKQEPQPDKTQEKQSIKETFEEAINELEEDLLEKLIREPLPEPIEEEIVKKPLKLRDMTFLAPTQEEEEDEILKALDRYFDAEDKD